jgi:hypothetical protein
MPADTLVPVRSHMYPPGVRQCCSANWHRSSFTGHF